MSVCIDEQIGHVSVVHGLSDQVRAAILTTLKDHARLQQDARRWRFLRDGNPNNGWILGRYPHMFGDVELNWDDKDAVDAAIDSAMSSGSGL
jgi:hypothetical protein